MSMHQSQYELDLHAPFKNDISRTNEDKKVEMYTFKIVSIRSLVLSNANLTSLATVDGLGIKVPGRPVFMRISNCGSLTMIIGQLLSAHHLVI
jgi:hypothetical protein